MWPLAHAPPAQALVARYSSLREFKFPPKKWFGSFGTSTVEKRRENFELYLRELVRGPYGRTVAWVLCAWIVGHILQGMRTCLQFCESAAVLLALRAVEFAIG